MGRHSNKRKKNRPTSRQELEKSISRLELTIKVCNFLEATYPLVVLLIVLLILYLNS